MNMGISDMTLNQTSGEFTLKRLKMQLFDSPSIDWSQLLYLRL